MRRLYKLVVTVAFAFLFSCSSNSEHKADHPPARILIVGNSIVRHPPAPGLEWFGDWGMAASAPDKDLVYQYTAKVMAEYDAVVESQNITFWENDFSYDLDQYTNLGAHQYDLVIVRLGENVLDTDSYAQALKEMADHFRADGG